MQRNKRMERLKKAHRDNGKGEGVRRRRTKEHTLGQESAPVEDLGLDEDFMEEDLKRQTTNNLPQEANEAAEPS
jgi:hypothetical protein